MTGTAATPQGVPIITADPFTPENLMQPHPLHEQLREAGPVVYLERYNIWAMARYEQVNASLKNWETYSSAAGAGLSNFLKEKPWRTPSLLLEADPPHHTRALEIVGPILSPPAMRAVRAHFESEAAALVDRLVSLGSFGQTVARLEGEIMLTALANRVERIEFTSQPQRKPNNTLLSWSSLPIAIHTAPHLSS